MTDNESHALDQKVTERRPRLQRRFQSRVLLLAVLVAAVWIDVLLDRQAAWLLLILLGGPGIALGLMGAAMALGFLGFGLCITGDRVIGWLHRGSQWPDE